MPAALQEEKRTAATLLLLSSPPVCVPAPLQQQQQRGEGRDWQLSGPISLQLGGAFLTPRQLEAETVIRTADGFIVEVCLTDASLDDCMPGVKFQFSV